MRAELRGGPVDKRIVTGVGEECWSIKIPANNLREPKHAHYKRVGDITDKDGKRLLFDFEAIYPGMGIS